MYRRDNRTQFASKMRVIVLSTLVTLLLSGANDALAQGEPEPHVWQDSHGFEAGLGLPRTFGTSPPWITQSIRHRGSHALGCETSEPVFDAGQNSQVIIADKDDYGHLNFTKVRYIGMAFYPPELDYEDSAGVMILEVDQHGRWPPFTGIGVVYPLARPPFAIDLRFINGLPRIAVIVIDSDGEAHNLTNGWRSVRLEEWSEVMVRIEPRHKNDPDGLLGSIQVKLNGNLIADRRLHWGYDPDDASSPGVGGHDGNPSDNWRISAGIADSHPFELGSKFKLYLDDVKLGNSWSAVDPSPASGWPTCSSGQQCCGSVNNAGNCIGMCWPSGNECP